MENLLDFLQTFESRGEQAALIYLLPNQRSVFSYGELYNHSLRLATWFKNEGVKEGDRVAFALPNSPLAVVCFFAIVSVGAVAVPITLGLKPEEISRVIQDSGSKLVISHASAYNPAIKNCRWIMQEQLPAIIEQAQPLNLQQQIIQPDDLAEILYTSGSTGQQKGVCLSHKNLIASISQHSSRLFGLGPGSNILSVMNFSQNYGQVAGTFVPLALGATVVFSPAVQFADLLQVWLQENITSMFAVPVELKYFKQVIEWMPKDRQQEIIKQLKKNFKYFTCGGYALEPQIFEYWENLGFPVLESYGMSECSHISNSNLKERRTGSAGKALPGVSIKIVDEEILIKGDNVFAGYWQDPAATRAAFTDDGFYKTKDLGKLEDGFLTITGRREEGIGSVMPSSIEQVLNSIEGVKDSCVIAKHEKGQVLIHAVLILENNIDGKKVIGQANQNLPKPSQIKSFSLWTESGFPKTATSKLQRFKVSRAVNDYALPNN